MDPTTDPERRRALRNMRTLQPEPKKNRNKYIYKLVLKDIDTRARLGKEKYGVYLQANNGRDALRDAYEEALDLCQYLRQAMFERDGE